LGRQARDRRGHPPAAAAKVNHGAALRFAPPRWPAVIFAASCIALVTVVVLPSPGDKEIRCSV
jgi:hypothetical protein